MLWVTPFISLEVHVTLTPDTVPDLHDERSLYHVVLHVAMPCGRNTIGMTVHIRYLCEKWFYKKSKDKIPAQISRH